MPENLKTTNNLERKYTEEEIEIAYKLLILSQDPVIFVNMPPNEKQLYRCEIKMCPFETNRRWNLTRHMRNLHKNRRTNKKKTKYSCLTCEYRFTNWINLARHSSVHCVENLKIFTCNCGWMSNIYEQLLYHKQEVHKIKDC